MGKAMGRGLGALIRAVEDDDRVKEMEIKQDPHAQKKRDIIIYKNVFERAWADRGVTRDEREMLLVLSDTLDLTDEEVRKIEDYVKARCTQDAQAVPSEPGRTQG